MSTLPIVTFRFRDALRKEAHSLVMKPGYRLNQAQDDVAKKHGFHHWKHLTDQHGAYQRQIERYRKYPVFFWDPKDIDDHFNDDCWLPDYSAFDVCYDLLWKKPRIASAYHDRESSMLGVLYTGSWSSVDDLTRVATDQLFFLPNYVFINGCFLPFDELERVSLEHRELEKVETGMVIYDEVEPYLDKLHDRMIAGILDFSGRFKWSLNIDIFDSENWSPMRAGEFVRDMMIEQVILVAPPEDVVRSLKNRLGGHLVHVVKLDF